LFERTFSSIAATTESTNTQYAATLAAIYEINDAWEFEVAGVYGRTNLFADTDVPARGSPVNTSDTDSQLWSIDTKLTGTLFNIAGGEVGVAFGGQYREETYDRLFLPSGISNTGDRQISSLFAEVAVPIVGEANAIPGLKRLDLSLAVRHENYSDFGSTTDPKFGIVWSPIDSLDIRGTWGTSFRAPSLDQLDLDPTRRLAFFLDFPDPSMADGLTTALFEFSERNDMLGPESSTAFTAGFDYHPEALDGFDLSFTYFNVKYEDRISQPTTSVFTAFLNRDIFASVIQDNPTVAEVDAFVAQLGDPLLFAGVLNFSGRPFNPAEVESIFDGRIQNLSSTDVSGIDFSVSYDIASDGFGNIGFSLDGNYLFEFTNQVTPQTLEDNVVDTLLRPIDWRLRGGVVWSKGGLTTAGFVSYQDDYTNNVTIPATQIDSWTTVDLNISYDTSDRFGSWVDNTIIAVNVQNLFDEDPPFVAGASSLVGSGFVTPISYDPTNASPLGRFISFEIRKSW